MLVLTRRAEQSVVIGGSAGFERMLKVTVLEIKGSQVRLGFDADADVPVHRWEVGSESSPAPGQTPRRPTSRRIWATDGL